MKYILMLLSFNASAVCYLDAAVSYGSSKDDIYVAEKGYAVKWEAPFFSAELGCTKGKWTGAIRHTSSIKQNDFGLNVAEIRYRVFEW